MNSSAENTTNRPRIVIFGAGNIGRSFIAPVFTRGGYEAVFADVAPAVLKALETRGRYALIETAEAGETRHEVGPVRGVDARDAAAVKKELDGADICATCVGAGALPAVLRTLVGAVAGRVRPLDIILAENLKGAGDMVRSAFLAAGIPEEEISRRLGIVETSIGKMVPIMPAEEAAADPLLCRAESYNTLIVDADGFTGRVPAIPDLMAVSPIEPWVARKLYIHNFGHAAAAYLGHRRLPGARFIWEVLEDRGAAAEVGAAMGVAGRALRLEYPGVFTAEHIESHVSDLISRFRNRALGDTLYRVGRDLRRKLHRRDRVVGALELVLKHGLSVQAPLEVFQAALDFRVPGPSGAPDAADLEVIAATGNPETFLREIVGIPPDDMAGTGELLIGALRDRLMDEIKV
jgi:mannitol-1-phosphate 5-dehydrogenase